MLAALLALRARAALAGQLAYVANSFSADVSLIDASSDQGDGTLPVGEFPSAVVFSPVGRFAYVANAGAAADPTAEADSITALDVQGGAPLQTVAVGDSPQSLTLSPDGRLLYVVNAGRPGVSDGSLSILDARASRLASEGDPLLGTAPLGGDPAGIAVSPDGKLLYIANSAFTPDNVVFVVDATAALADPEHAVVDRITVGNGPIGIALTPDGRYAYVTNFGFGSNSVSVIDLLSREVIRTVTVGSRPAGVAVSPDGGFVYVTNFIGLVGTVSVIEIASNQVKGTVTVGSAPYAVAFTPDGAFAYVANRQSLTVPAAGTVSIIDTALALTNPSHAVTGTVDVGQNPAAVAITQLPPESLVSAVFAPLEAEDADVNRDDRVSVADLLAWQQQIARGDPADQSI